MTSLGFAKPPSATRVVVAMSGGVDSSTVAALLKEEGFEVVGITLQLYDHGQAVGRKGACCAGQDIHDARRVADSLGIPHYVLDYEERFRAEVIEDFAASYAKGETPIPCVTCNRTVKFRDLLGIARDLGAEALATGHYARRVLGPRGPELRRARDRGRDQSYFLFGTTREQLGMLRFPLGELEKEEVRRLAEGFALPVAAKPDSQDICFVPEGSYARIVERLRPGAIEPGEIVDLEGRVLGRIAGSSTTRWASAGAWGSAHPSRSMWCASSPSAGASWSGREKRCGSDTSPPTGSIGWGRGPCLRAPSRPRSGFARAIRARGRGYVAWGRGGSRSRSMSPRWASRRARPRSSMTASGCWAAPGSSAPRPDRRIARCASWRRRAPLDSFRAATLYPSARQGCGGVAQLVEQRNHNP